MNSIREINNQLSIECGLSHKQYRKARKRKRLMIYKYRQLPSSVKSLEGNKIRQEKHTVTLNEHV